MPQVPPSKKILKNQIEPLFTAAPIGVANSILTQIQPELLRLPKSGTRDAVYGTSRSGWNNLILPCKANNFRPPIKSISHRKPGAIRGVRLIVAASARAYFSKLIAEAEAANATEPSQPVRKTRRSQPQSKGPRK
jgi:hypothetical protein